MKNELLPGLRYLCAMYLVNVALYSAALVIFENRIFVCGREAGIVIGTLVRVSLIFIPLYLVFRLRSYAFDAWIGASCFHLFFIVNNLMSFFEHAGSGHALLRIAGLYGDLSYSKAQITWLSLATLLNIAIFYYLMRIREYFFAND